jgi:hypothetical protein
MSYGCEYYDRYYSTPVVHHVEQFTCNVIQTDTSTLRTNPTRIWFHMVLHGEPQLRSRYKYLYSKKCAQPLKTTGTPYSSTIHTLQCVYDTYAISYEYITSRLAVGVKLAIITDLPNLVSSPLLLTDSWTRTARITCINCVNWE